MGAPMIAVREHPNGGATLQPTSFLGRDLFRRYLDIVSKIPGCVYEPKYSRQRLKDLDLLPELLDQLEQAGFAVALAPELASVSAEVAKEAGAERARILAEMERAEARIAASGLAPFPYQRDGILWMASRRTGLLGDEMGLGKTVQALLSIPEGSHAVVVCPASLKGNWAAECLRWRPDLKPSILGGRGSFRFPAGPRELCIINDDVLPPHDGEFDIPPANALVIYDEAHRGKGGKKTQRGRNFIALRKAVLGSGGRVLLMTGTPLVNRYDELRAVLQLADLFGEAFGSYPKFKQAIAAGTVAEGLRKVCLARRREDVLPDLPTKMWDDISVEISPEMMERLDAIVAALAEKGYPVSRLDRRMLSEPVVFELISKIRAALAQAKIPAMMEYVERCEEEGNLLVVFSAHRPPIDLLGSRPGWATITGSTPVEERTEVVRRFQARELKGIAGTIGAMGVGVTLTAAHHGLFVDLDWTPAGNSQAEDRMCRIGQKDAVQITTLIANHELDARVSELLQEKATIIDESVTEAARGRQTTAADMIAELERKEAVALAHAAAHLERASVYQAEQERVQRAEQAALAARQRLAGAPPGSYAVQEEPGGPVTLWKVDVVTEGSWAGWIFVAALQGGRAVPAGALKPNNQWSAKPGFDTGRIRSVLHLVGESPLEAAERYARETGSCGICGKLLTNEESPKRGIGPVCRARFGA